VVTFEAKIDTLVMHLLGGLARERKPLVYMCGNVYLAGLPQEFVASNPIRHALSLLTQAVCLTF